MAGVRLTVAQLLTSLVIGLSGGKILTLMAEKQAATISKDQLAAAVKALTKG
jgi:pseudouridine-5'-phosphate glycosidase